MCNIFTFQKNCTFETIGSIFKSLKNYIFNNREISLDFSQINSVDITFLQVICSLHFYLENNKITLKNNGVIPESIKNFAIEAGFLFTIKNCKFKNTCPFSELIKD